MASSSPPRQERWFHTLVQNSHEPVSAAKLGQLCAEGDIAGLRKVLGQPQGQEVEKKEVDSVGGEMSGTPLFFAAGHGKLEIVKMLVEDYGACPDKGRPIDINLARKPDPRTLDGASPLLVAAKMGQVAVVRYLLNSGADADLAMADGATPLTVAVQAGHVDIVTALVAPSGAKKGANVNQPEDDGWTPLMLACLGGVPSGETTAKFLFANGADRDAVAKDGTCLSAEVVRVTRQTADA